VRAEIKKQMDQLRSDGIIEDTPGPWASEIVVVIKGTKIRICGNNRLLNDITVTHTFPLPDIRVILQTASGSCYYGKFDLLSAFFQMLMDPDSIPMASVMELEVSLY